MGKRIWQYPEVEELSEGDVILLDSPEEGSRSIPANKIGSILIDKEITERGTYNAVDDDANGYKTVEANIPYTDIHVATGSIATFEGEDLPLKSLTASIVPVQAGSGDPSPTNVRPITGWTEEVIRVNKKNFFDVSKVSVESISCYSLDGTPATQPGFAWHLPNDTYTLSVGADSNTYIYMNVVNRDGSWVSSSRLHGGSTQFYTPTITLADGQYVIVYKASSGTINLENLNLQIELGTTATTYEPYAGNTYTIPFTDSQGQSVEVFGGSVDVVNGGEQPSPFGFAEFDGSENWQLFANGVFYLENAIDTDSLTDSATPTMMCNMYKEETAIANSTYVEQRADFSFFNQRTYKNRLWIKDSRFSTVEAFKTALASQKLQVKYTLATPTTFYTQPTAIKSLEGKNNVWASTGDVDVEYQTVWRGDTIQAPRYRLYNEEYISVKSDYDNSIQISWDTGSYVGCSLNGILDLSGKGFKKLKYDVTFGSKNYDSEYSQNIRPFIVGVTDQIYNQYVYANQDNVASYFKAHNLYDVNYLNQHVTGEVDISKVSGPFYLLVVATGWNVKINSLVLE